MLRIVSSLGICMLLPLLARSAPPAVTAITPRGAPRGQPIEIVVAGKDLADETRLLFPFKAKVERLPDKPNPAQARFLVEIDPSVPLGLYPLQVVSPDGVAALQWFVVDSLPQVNEAENNQPREQAQVVPFGATVNGQCAGGDVDFFRFPVKKGQRLVLETEAARLGAGVLPQLRLTDAMGRFLASDDAQKLRGDCRLLYQAPADGDYIVELSDSRYKGTAPAHYRLRIADYDVIEEVFPLGGQRGQTVEFTLYRSTTLAQPIKLRRKLEEPVMATLALDGLKLGGLPPEVVVGDLPEQIVLGSTPEPVEVPARGVVNGRLDQKGLAQRVRVPVQPGQKLRCTVEAEALGSYLDGVLRITDQAGKQLALADDQSVTLIAGQPPFNFADPVAEVTVPAGVTHLIAEVRDQRSRGGVNFGYRLTIEPAATDFDVRQPVSELNVPRGGSIELIIPVLRLGYNGPLQLRVANLPPGLAVHGGHVPPGAAAGALTLTGQADITDPVQLGIEGVATIDGKEVRRAARQQLLISKEATPSFRSLTRFSAAMTTSEPFGVQGPPAIEAVLGYPVNVAVTVTRDPQAKIGAVDVSGGVPPFLSLDDKTPANAPFAVQPAAAAAESATVILTPKASAPEGVMTLLVQGKTKVNNKDASVVGPAVTLTLKPPFTVEPPGAVELTAGMTATLTGKLRREPVFKEGIQWKVDGLPKGVTLVKPPSLLPPDATEYQVELKADPKLAADKLNLSLGFSTTIGGAPYNHAPVVVPLVVK